MDGYSKMHGGLTVANTLAIVLMGFYFQRSISTIKGEVDKISEALSAVVKSVSEIKGTSTKIDQIIVALQRLDHEVKLSQEDIKGLVNEDDFLGIATQLNVMMQGMKDYGIDM